MGNRKLPFGYKMVMGEIVVHPQEAQAVQGIYLRKGVLFVKLPVGADPLNLNMSMEEIDELK